MWMCDYINLHTKKKKKKKTVFLVWAPVFTAKVFIPGCQLLTYKPTYWSIVFSWAFCLHVCTGGALGERTTQVYGLAFSSIEGKKPIRWPICESIRVFLKPLCISDLSGHSPDLCVVCKHFDVTLYHLWDLVNKQEEQAMVLRQNLGAHCWWHWPI